MTEGRPYWKEITDHLILIGPHPEIPEGAMVRYFTRGIDDAIAERQVNRAKCSSWRLIERVDTYVGRFAGYDTIVDIRPIFCHRRKGHEGAHCVRDDPDSYSYRLYHWDQESLSVPALR